MDGLRGLAAFSVFNHHFLSMFTYMTKIGFGYSDKYLQPLGLPIVRLMMDGASAVCIFFTISGYVVAASSLKTIAEGRARDLIQPFSRSVFRRGFRLFLPMLCVMTLTALSAYCGLFEYSRYIMDDPKSLKPAGIGYEPSLKRYGRFKWQMNFLFKEFWKNTNIIDDQPYYSTHDPHLWTMSYEYRSSLMVYMAIVGLSSCRPHMRLLGLTLLGVVQLILQRWEGPLFFGGAVFAELAAWKHARKPAARMLPLSTKVGSSDSAAEKHGSELGQMRKWHSRLRILLFILALYLMSYPMDNMAKPAPGYAWINYTIPSWYKRKQRFPRTIGTLLLVYLLTTVSEQRSSIWMRLLNSTPARYMGRYMFSFYLVHGPLLHMIGYALPRLIWARIGYQTYWTYVVGLTGGWFLSLLLCLCAAEVFEREVVARCVAATTWLEDVCFVRVE
jgi:peptidoglycan/LPS O-acetylase OafA/YrhL